MGTLLTSASAQTALRQLRSVQNTGDAIRSQISTGLKVQTADDNAAFFVVAAKTRGDIAVLSGIKENLTLSVGAVTAAQSAGAELNNILTNLADIIGQAQTGTALEELDFTYDALTDQVRDIINAAGFQGVNLLESDDSISTVTGIDRNGGAFNLQTLNIDGGDFNRKAYNNAIIETAGEFVLNAENFTGSASVGTAEWSASTTDPGFLVWEDLPGPNLIYFTPADVAANAPRLDYTVQVTNPGTYFVNVKGRGPNGAADSVHVGIDGAVLTGTGGVQIPQGGGGWGEFDTLSSTRVSVDITTPGLYTINIWGREDGTLIDGIVFTQDPTLFADSDPLPPVTSLAGNADLPFFTDLAEGEERRATAGFTELLDAITASAAFFAPESAMVVLDGARSKLNRYMSELGAYEKTLLRQQEYLTNLTSGLDVAIGDLVETDLEEASGQLAAIQVQEQLAIQGLSITNSRASLTLQLFQ